MYGKCHSNYYDIKISKRKEKRMLNKKITHIYPHLDILNENHPPFEI